MLEDIWSAFDKEMEELDKILDNLLKSLGLGNNDN